MTRIFFLALMLCLFVVGHAQATTYWVSTAGGATLCSQIDGDGDPGAYMTLAAIDTNNCATSGDTVTFKAGTYTGTHKYMDTLFVSPSGTSANTRTKVLCEGDQTCTIAFNSGSCCGGNLGTGGQNVRYFQIGDRGRGFISDCVNGGTACSGMRLNLPTASGGAYVGNVIRGNRVRNYHRNGIANREHDLAAYFDGTEISWNVIEGYATPLDTGAGPSHAIYVSQVNTLVEHNDVSTGAAGSPGDSSQLAIQCFHMCDGSIFRYNILRVKAPSNGFVASHDDIPRIGGSKVQFHHNTCKAISGTPLYCASAYAKGTPIDVYHNVAEGFTNLYYQFSYGGTHSTTVIRNNAGTGSTAISCSITPAACTSSNNTLNLVASTHFTDPTNADYSLKAGSSLIDAGVAIAGFAYNGSAPDIGAFERFGFSTATVNQNFLDVTVGQNIAVHSPIQPIISMTGFTALVGAVPRGTVSVTRLTGTDSTIRIAFDGAVCTGGQTWTVTYAPGNVTDSSLVGGAFSQPLSAFTAQAVTNACGVAPPTPPAGLQ